MSRRFDDLSQEIAVVIDASGAISYRDNRAEEVIGDAASLRALATPGTEEKVDRLVTRALSEPVDRFEVSLVVAGKPATFAFRTMPEGGGAAMVGLRLNEEVEATVVDRAKKARALGADEFWLKPIDGERLIRKLSRLARRGHAPRVLVIDDDPAARYLVCKLLEDSPYSVLEAENATEGVRAARRKRPDVILLDFVLGTETAFDVIDDLKASADTRSIPVILQTAKTLDEVERERIARETSAIIKKESLSREVAIARIREALEASGLRGDHTRVV